MAEGVDKAPKPDTPKERIDKIVSAYKTLMLRKKDLRIKISQAEQPNIQAGQTSIREKINRIEIPLPAEYLLSSPALLKENTKIIELQRELNELLDPAQLTNNPELLKAYAQKILIDFTLKQAVLQLSIQMIESLVAGIIEFIESKTTIKNDMPLMLNRRKTILINSIKKYISDISEEGNMSARPDIEEETDRRFNPSEKTKSLRMEIANFANICIGVIGDPTGEKAEARQRDRQKRVEEAQKSGGPRRN